MALDPTHVSAFLSEHPDWTVNAEGAFERVFSFDDHFAGHDLADRLAHHAEDVDHHPDLSIGWRKLTVRLKTHSANALTDRDTEFVEWIDSFFRIKEAAKLMRNPRPARELSRAWVDAVDQWVAVVQKLSADDLTQPIRKGEKRSILETAVRSPMASGFGDLSWIRGVLELPATETGKKRDDIDALNGFEALMAVVPDWRTDIAATLAQLYEGILADRAYLTELGHATVEQVINRAIVYVHRTRLAIEDFMAAKSTG